MEGKDGQLQRGARPAITTAVRLGTRGGRVFGRGNRAIGLSAVAGRPRPVAQRLPGRAGGMQAGAGGELTWATVALPPGVVSKPTT